MSKEQVFITVIGKDKKGIVARISNLLFKAGINIDDINQKLTDKYFIMTMLADIASASCSLEVLRTKLAKLGKEMGLSVQLQHENIFKMMHRI